MNAQQHVSLEKPATFYIDAKVDGRCQARFQGKKTTTYEMMSASNDSGHSIRDVKDFESFELRMVNTITGEFSKEFGKRFHGPAPGMLINSYNDTKNNSEGHDSQSVSEDELCM